MAVPSDRERLVRLETRAREAEVALRQLKSYVQLLNQKAGTLFNIWSEYTNVRSILSSHFR